MLPVMGWNEYTMDVCIIFIYLLEEFFFLFQGARVSCCINWYDRRTSYILYLFFLFIVVYCIPLIILTIANTITLRGLKKMREKIATGVQTEFNQKRIEMERRIVKSKNSIEKKRHHLLT